MTSEKLKNQLKEMSKEIIPEINCSIEYRNSKMRELGEKYNMEEDKLDLRKTIDEDATISGISIDGDKVIFSFTRELEKKPKSGIGAILARNVNRHEVPLKVFDGDFSFVDEYFKNLENEFIEKQKKDRAQKILRAFQKLVRIKKEEKIELSEEDNEIVNQLFDRWTMDENFDPVDMAHQACGIVDSDESECCYSDSYADKEEDWEDSEECSVMASY